jgi:hypothetical protein
VEDQRPKTKWAYKKLSTYKTPYRIIWNTINAGIPKRNFSLLSNPLVLFNRIFKGVAFYLQKDNKTDHLRDKELFTATKTSETCKIDY